MANVAPSLEEFLAAYPVFVNASQEAVQAQLNLSTRLLSSAAWGEDFSDGVALDAAHNLTLEQLASSPNGAFQGTAGPITSVSGGGISTSFSASEWNSKSWREGWYVKTVYGQRLLRLWSVVVSPVALCS